VADAGYGDKGCSGESIQKSGYEVGVRRAVEVVKLRTVRVRSLFNGDLRQ
jgi:hypothetical protein